MRAIDKSVSHQMTLIQVVEESRRDRADAAVHTWRREWSNVTSNVTEESVYMNVD